MNITSDICELRSTIKEYRAGSNTIGLVPTMGALHEGHMSLVEASRSVCSNTVVSIFVNPTQFSPNEDLDEYPRTFDEDCQKLNAAGVDLVYSPTHETMYPEGFSTYVQPPALGKVLEGEKRPTHFRGVTTVVLKLFNLVQPDWAFFGQKDYQQAAVIKKMVFDLNVPVEIEVCPIVRDFDGMALSSRNRYLSANERKAGLSLIASLRLAERLIREGEIDARVINAEMTQSLVDGGCDSIDYALLADPDTLALVDQVQGPVVALLAAHVGSTRLIDNCLIA